LSRDTIIIIQLLEQDKKDTLREISVKLIDVIDDGYKITTLSNTDRLQLKAPHEQIKGLVETFDASTYYKNYRAIVFGARDLFADRFQAVVVKGAGHGGLSKVQAAPLKL
jgi:hypothetical protein